MFDKQIAENIARTAQEEAAFDAESMDDVLAHIKAARKAAGRETHKLRCRGLPAPDIVIEGPSVLRPVQRELARCWASLPDRMGARFVWLERFRQDQPGPCPDRVMASGVAGPDGLAQFHCVLRGSAHKRRAALAGMRIQDIPEDYARHLLVSADTLNPAPTQTLVNALPQLGNSGRNDWTPANHPAWSEVGITPLAPGPDTALEQTVALLAVEPVQQWGLTVLDAERMQGAVRGAMDGKLVLSPEMERERALRAIKIAARVYFSLYSRRVEWACRLMDVGLLLGRAKGDKAALPLAQLALAAAAHLLNSKSDPADLTYIQAVIEGALR